MKSAAEWAGSIGGMLGYAPWQPLEIGYSESNVNLYVKWGNIGGLVGLLFGGPSKYLEIHDNLIKWNIKVKSNSGNVGWVLGNGSYIRAQNNIAQPAGSNKILAEWNGTVEGIGGFVWQATSSEFTHNKTNYSIQGNTRGTIGGFWGRIDNSVVSRNAATGSIGGENSKWPHVYYVGGSLRFEPEEHSQITILQLIYISIMIQVYITLADLWVWLEEIPSRGIMLPVPSLPIIRATSMERVLQDI